MREMERRCIQEGPGKEEDVGITETLAVEEFVSIEWSEVQEDDSDSWGSR